MFFPSLSTIKECIYFSLDHIKVCICVSEVNASCCNKKVSQFRGLRKERSKLQSEHSFCAQKEWVLPSQFLHLLELQNPFQKVSRQGKKKVEKACLHCDSHSISIVKNQSWSSNQKLGGPGNLIAALAAASQQQLYTMKGKYKF